MNIVRKSLGSTSGTVKVQYNGRIINTFRYNHRGERNKKLRGIINDCKKYGGEIQVIYEPDVKLPKEKNDIK